MTLLSEPVHLIIDSNKGFRLAQGTEGTLIVSFGRLNNKTSCAQCADA